MNNYLIHWTTSISEKLCDNEKILNRFRDLDSHYNKELSEIKKEITEIETIMKSIEDQVNKNTKQYLEKLNSLQGDPFRIFKEMYNLSDKFFSRKDYETREDWVHMITSIWTLENHYIRLKLNKIKLQEKADKQSEILSLNKDKINIYNKKINLIKQESNLLSDVSNKLKLLKDIKHE